MWLPAGNGSAVAAVSLGSLSSPAIVMLRTSSR